MSTSQTELKTLQAEIADLRQRLAGLPKEQIDTILQPYLEREAALTIEVAKIGNVGSQTTIAQGTDNTVLGPNAINIQGDNIHVTQLIRATKTDLSAEELRTQIGHYLNWLIETSGTLELRGIRRQGEQVVQLALDTVYVPLAARRGVSGSALFGRQEEETHHRSRRSKSGELEDAVLEATGSGHIHLDQLLAQGRRLIISGGPGCGKTTVLLHLAWAMGYALAHNDPAFAAQKIGHDPKKRLLFPISLPLSRYAAHLRKLTGDGISDPEERTLATFISRYLIEQQAGVRLPRDFYDQLLASGRQILLLLDGLDEVPTEQERILVRQAIENLVAGRDQLTVIVTCRSAAYKGRVALGRGFREIDVLPLSDNHLSALIHNAYRAIEISNPAQAERRASELLDSITKLEAQRRARMGERAEPLVTSPLLVRMLLIVHVSERRLPDRRAELYQKATEVLIAPDYNPDEQVALDIAHFVGDFAKHLSLVQYLAFHMHQRGNQKRDAEDQQGREIEEDDLITLLNEPTAGFQAVKKPFITTTRERGTLMEERFGLYRFIHLSFQEFLVARYIAEIIRDDGGQAAMLDFLLAEDRLLDSWWREPILLIIGYLSIDKHTSATRFAHTLLNLSHTHPYLSPDLHWAAAELAAVAVNEWTDADPALRAAAAEKIVDLIGNIPAEQPPSTPGLRARVGIALAQLGDPRPGVVDIDQLPFCYVPPGPFMMGKGREDKEHYQQDCLDYGYWIARYPITFGHFRAFMDDNGYFTAEWWPEAIAVDYWTPRGYRDKYNAPRDTYDLNHPVVKLSWYEALAFTRWLNARWTDRLPAGYQLRLPTIAEWEKGARGGLEIPKKPVIRTLHQTNPNEQGNQPHRLLDTGHLEMEANRFPHRNYPWPTPITPQHANIEESNIGQPSTVGLFPAGQTHLWPAFDMIGNVI